MAIIVTNIDGKIVPNFKLVIPQNKLPPLTYCSQRTLQIGDVVVTPFRNKLTSAIVWGSEDKPIKTKLKEIEPAEEFQCQVDDKLIKFMQKMSGYYLAPISSIAKLVLPLDINEKPIKVLKQELPEGITLPPLSQTQQTCFNEALTCTSPLLLKGVTGSGKTEVYFHLLLEKVRQNKQALILLPEIALSKQIISRFTQRFGFEPAIWNSTITKAKKKQILRGIITGDVKVVIGARSALFLPYKELGLIIVDEEHDPSYKQSDGVTYNARDMAVLRGGVEKCLVMLASATPSIETIQNVSNGKYRQLTLSSRYKQAQKPSIEILDLKEHQCAKNTWLSPPVRSNIADNLAKKEQTLLFLNRRGYAPLILCTGCGHKVQCAQCSAYMVTHRQANSIACHHCGHSARIPKQCPDCDSENSLIMHGPGIERIEEEVRELFPHASIKAVSRDINSNPKDMQELLEDMEQGNIDILIGTQLITKGYHFPNLTLVVIVDADIGCLGGDLRAAERMFQMLHQVGGRAGRAEKAGHVLLQTYSPDNRVIQAIALNEEESYLQEELCLRQKHNMPPFARIAAITISGKNDLKTKMFAQEFARHAPASKAEVLGPTPAMMHKLSGKYRYKILVSADKNFNLQLFLETWQKCIKIPSTFHLKIDIDPQELW